MLYRVVPTITTLRTLNPHPTLKMTSLPVRQFLPQATTVQYPQANSILPRCQTPTKPPLSQSVADKLQHQQQLEHHRLHQKVQELLRSGVHRWERLRSEVLRPEGRRLQGEWKFIWYLKFLSLYKSCNKELKLIHSADPQSRLVVITIFTYVILCRDCGSTRGDHWWHKSC